MFIALRFSKVRNNGANRCADVLELIHTNICGPITPTAMGGHKCFSTFIDDFIRFGWIGFLQEKYSSLNAFKSFKVIIELKRNKMINCVRFDRGGKYCGADLVRLEEIQDLLSDFLKIVVLKLNILCLVNLSKMELQKDKNAFFKIR